MFGIGLQELVIIELLTLLILGRGKLARMARNLGKFARKTQCSMDAQKSEMALVETQGEGAAGQEKEPKEDDLSSAPAERQEGSAQQRPADKRGDAGVSEGAPLGRPHDADHNGGCEP